jgi:hypothetical protein
VRKTLIALVLVLCALGAQAGTITSISPSSIKVNSGEHFITINGTGLGSVIVFDGPAGQFELNANATFSGSVVFWVPLAVVGRSGTHTVYVRGGTGDSNSVPFYVEGFKFFPLVILTPDVLRVQPKTREGVYVKYEVMALGGEDSSPTVRCFPESGSFFKMGATTVDCSASNLSGEKARSSFTVLVADSEGPVIYLPEPIQVKAESPEGAIVEYDVKAYDEIWGDAIPECLPRSGDVFPVGLTNVACIAKDLDDNVTSATFPVEVLGEREFYELTLYVPDIRVEASDPIGEKVEWKVEVEGTEDREPVVSCSHENGSLFPVGVTVVECSALDAWGMRGKTTFTVDVADINAPYSEAYASPDRLTADGRMVPIEIKVEVKDDIDPEPHCFVFGVSSNQKISTGDDMDPKEGDWAITGDLTLELRAEYTKTDRYYDVWVSCSDFYGNGLATTTRVIVPAGTGQSVTPPTTTKRRAGGKG